MQNVALNDKGNATFEQELLWLARGFRLSKCIHVDAHKDHFHDESLTARLQ